MRDATVNRGDYFMLDCVKEQIITDWKIRGYM